MTAPDPTGEKLLEAVRGTLAVTRPDADLDSLDFLAAGEYTFNFRVHLGDTDAVIRIITGSQMGLDAPDQARYEAHALEVLAVTEQVPTLIDVQPGDAHIGYPYLLLGFLPGRPLDYSKDLAAAARCVAAIHRFPIPAEHRLQLHADPVTSILDETAMLVAELEGLEWDAVRALRERVIETPLEVFATVGEDQTIINTDLNSHNFIVDEERVWLIDWEKARIGASLMDIAHFLLPTTTLWRDSTATRLTEVQREVFIDAYLRERPALDPERYRAGLLLAQRLAALRAVAWCAWSVAASRRGERPIENDETLAKSRLYSSPEFLDELVDELWG